MCHSLAMIRSYLILIEGWTCNSYPSMAPRSFYDCFDRDFISWIKDNAEDQAAMALAATGFPAEVHDELEQPSELPFDTLEGSEDVARVDPGEAAVHNLPATAQTGEKVGSSYHNESVRHCAGCAGNSAIAPRRYLLNFSVQQE